MIYSLLKNIFILCQKSVFIIIIQYICYIPEDIWIFNYNKFEIFQFSFDEMVENIQIEDSTV